MTCEQQLTVWLRCGCNDLFLLSSSSSSSSIRCACDAHKPSTFVYVWRCVPPSLGPWGGRPFALCGHRLATLFDCGCHQRRIWIYESKHILHGLCTLISWWVRDGGNCKWCEYAELWCNAHRSRPPSCFVVVVVVLGYCVARVRFGNCWHFKCVIDGRLFPQEMFRLFSLSFCGDGGRDDDPSTNKMNLRF